MFAHMPQPYIVGVTGGSGSGKTSFVQQLRDRLGHRATFFSQDNYYVSTDVIAVDQDGIHNFDLPGSIDSAAMAADVRKVRDGETIHRKEYTFQTIYVESEGAAGSTGRVGELLALRPAEIMVVEGLFVLHESALSELMDLRVYVDASDVVKLTRRIKRDRIDRQLPLEDVLYRYERHVLPAYQKYIEPYKRQADLVVNNESDFSAALDVLCGFLLSRNAD